LHRMPPWHPLIETKEKSIDRQEHRAMRRSDRAHQRPAAFRGPLGADAALGNDLLFGTWSGPVGWRTHPWKGCR